MDNGMSPTMSQKGVSLEDAFIEVEHPESLGLNHPEQLRLFHTAMRSNKLVYEDLQRVMYKNLARYAFSRSQMEDFKKNDEIEAAIDQAKQIMLANGGIEGNLLDEMLLYVFLEDKLDAPKLMSRVELKTDLAQYRSECKAIHLLAPKNLPKNTKYQMVFGASDIVNDIKHAIDKAFESLERIDAHESKEVIMVQKTAMDRMCSEDDIAVLKDVIIPQPSQPTNYDIAYGIFLGYKLGINSDRGEEFYIVAEQKMKLDIKSHAAYITQKINEKGLQNHSFYVFVVPFNNADSEKIDLMKGILEGGVSL